METQLVTFTQSHVSIFVYGTSTSTSPSDSADPSTDSLPSAQLPPLLARTGIAILVTTQGTLWLEWWRRKSNLPALARGVQDSQALEYNTAKNERSRLLLI